MAAADRGKELMQRIDDMDFSEFNGFLQQSPHDPHGAIPILEEPESETEWRFLRPFPQEFNTRIESLEWARNILNGRSVGAVDGSQIYPGSEFSFPIGLVNIGWYINHHDGNYECDHSSRLLLPHELGFNPDSGVNLLRENTEINKLIELFREAKQDDLLLLDGSMVLSFALHVFETTRQKYIDGILSLLDVLREDGPLFAAFIDNSRATDLFTMLSKSFKTANQLKLPEGGKGERGELSGIEAKGGKGEGDGFSGGKVKPLDASLLNGCMKWGDRTSAFICARDDILQYYIRGGEGEEGEQEIVKEDGKEGRVRGEDFSRDIAFFYMKTSIGRVGRVEFPKRIIEQGRVEELADMLRAQIIVGAGYPHAIDQAHHEANVSMGDRETFFGILQQVAESKGIDIGTSLKAAKKRH